MAEKDTVIKEKISKKNGIFNFRETYSFAFDWLLEQGYFVTEDKYSEKISGSGKEIEIVWSASKKLTDYFQGQVMIRWMVVGLTDVEAEIDGKKVKTNKAMSVDITTKGVLVSDYTSKWETSSTQKFFRELYNKYLIPGRIDDMGGKVGGLVQEFHAALRNFLEIEARR